jgi:spore coat polysaccharide biosynthesis protein SpsF
VTLGCIVQARSGSTRLPGKVLQEVAGKPLLAYLLERLAVCESVDEVCVATSVDDADDAVAALAARLGFACARGPHEDVAARFVATLDARGYDAVVRLCADSPLLDPALVDRAVSLFAEGGADLVTNVHPRTFPKGESVEVFSAEKLREAYPRMCAEDREHVTRHFYRHADSYRIRSFASDTDLSDVRLCVDTAEDMARVEAVVALMDRPQATYGMAEVLALLERAEGVA